MNRLIAMAGAGLSRLVVLTAVMALASCGGGGGGGDTPPPPPVNQPPTVNAGADLSVDPGQSVSITATASDSDGTIASYAWEQVDGPTVQLSGASTSTVEFTAPDVVSTTSLTLRVTVTDDDGATASDSVVVTVVSANQPPTVDAGADLSVNEQSAVSVTATASDPDGSIASYAWSRVSGPSVSLSGASTATVGFTAPAVSSVTTIVLRVTVTDDDGATASDTVSISVQPVAGLNIAPIANAGSDINAGSGQSVTLNGSASTDPDGSIATYAWSQTAGPNVSLSSTSVARPSFTAPSVSTSTVLTFRLVVTDNEGQASAPDSVNVTVSPVVTEVTLSGTITFDRVSLNPLSNTLDYSNIIATPAPWVRVQAIDASDGTTVLAATDTDDVGDYSMIVPASTNMRVRVRAEMVKTGAPSWDVRVVDNNGLENPPSRPLYVMEGSNFNSGTTNPVVSLNAPSGWTGSAYTQPRVAAPFSILYAIHQAMDMVLGVDATAIMPDLVINWSANNTVTSEVSTYYSPLNQELFLLGDADNDTDEYDHPVVIHEWGHYFEDRFSRSDNVGGSHYGGAILDMRVAFGEGWGNAVQSMARGDSLYWDTFVGSTGLTIDLEANCSSPRGWFNECSIGALLYDLFDDSAGGDTSGDNIAMGFGPIYSVLVNDQATTPALTGIHEFSFYLRQQNASFASGIDTLLSYHSIASGAGITLFGTTETNGASSYAASLDPGVDILPLYKTGLAVGVPVTVCVDVRAESENYNWLGNRQFLRFQVSAAGNYQITATNTSEPATAQADPDMYLYNRGETHSAFDDSSTTGIETFCDGTPGDSGSCAGGGIPMTTGVDYVLEVNDYNNLGLETTLVRGPYCMSITLTAL